MTQHVQGRRSNGTCICLLLAASAIFAACDADESLGPGAPRATGIVLEAAAAPLASLGDTAILSSRVLDRNGKPLSGVRLQWSVSPAGVVQQDGEGIYRAIGNGRAMVVAEIDPAETGVRPAGYWAGRLADTVMIEVQQRPARLSLEPVDTALGTLGAARQLHVQVTDARGNALLVGPPPLTWQSADSRVVVVDSAGMVRSMGEGSAAVSVQTLDLSAAVTFSVNPHRPHTSCMVFAQRGQTQQACVTLNFTLREREAVR